MKPKFRRLAAIIIFLIIGSLLLCISYLIRPKSPSGQDEFLSSALSNASFVLLTVVILDVIWGLLGGEPVSETLAELRGSVTRFETKIQQTAKLLADSKETGIHRIVYNSSDFATPSEWMNRLKL